MFTQPSQYAIPRGQIVLGNVSMTLPAGQMLAAFGRLYDRLYSTAQGRKLELDIHGVELAIVFDGVTVVKASRDFFDHGAWDISGHASAIALLQTMTCANALVA
jgi:hypothetical protein